MSEPTKDEAKDKKLYKVIDSNQRGKEPRKHDVITKMYPNGEPDTETYALWSDKATEMPMEHAMKFLCDPAFKVIAPSGNRIMPVPKIDPSRPITTLADDEIVVKYEELSREALYRRVKVLPGSEDIKENANGKELAEFLVGWRKKMRGMSAGERELASMMVQGELGGAMDKGGLDKMFGERKAA